MAGDWTDEPLPGDPPPPPADTRPRCPDHGVMTRTERCGITGDAREPGAEPCPGCTVVWTCPGLDGVLDGVTSEDGQRCRYTVTGQAGAAPDFTVELHWHKPSRHRWHRRPGRPGDKL